MEEQDRRKLVIASIIFVAVSALAGLGEGKWYSILPALIAVTVGFASQKLIAGLILGVLSGGILATVPGDPSLSSFASGLATSANLSIKVLKDPWNLKILAFVFLVMAMISVITVSGGFQALLKVMIRWANNKKSTQLSTSLMGILIFFDDYANTMIVGTAMRPLSDLHKISREKLAFIVDATAAPIAGLALVSTWVGYEIGLFGKVSQSLNMGMDGYGIFFDAIAFRFYCIFMLAFVFINGFTGRDFGPMLKAEQNPIYDDTEEAESSLPGIKESKVTALLPILILVVGTIVGLWYDGASALSDRSFGLASVFSFQDWRDIMSAAENSVSVFMYTSAAGLLAAMICSVLASKVSPQNVLTAVLKGLKHALNPAIILILAWSLKGACDTLGTDKFLALNLSQILSPLVFPALLFLLAGLMAFATGTSWGVMAILIPIAAPIALQLDGGTYGLITMISMGAVLDGAICGDHCSPISDTTILSSTASSCDHMRHVKTQLPYALTVAILAIALGYIPAAMGVSTSILAPLGVAAILAVHLIIGKKTIAS